MSNDYPPTAACVKCGGLCCQRAAGAMAPADVEPLTVGAVADLLGTGNYAVDWWEGDPRDDTLFARHPDDTELGRAYYLRPAHQDVITIRDPSWGGVCVFLAPGGCTLSLTERPAGCRALEPVDSPFPEDGRVQCIAHYSKQQAAVDWIPHQELLEDAVSQAEQVAEACNA